jgi:hypothetical protein
VNLVHDETHEHIPPLRQILRDSLQLFFDLQLEFLKHRVVLCQHSEAAVGSEMDQHGPAQVSRPPVNGLKSDLIITQSV